MKRWMMQLLRSVITLVLMIAMAYMIFDQRERIGAAQEEAKLAKAQVAVQQMQIDSLKEQLAANDPSKGVYVICRFDLKPEADLADYTAKTLEIVPTVRAEDGCRFYSLLKDADTDWEAPMKNERVYWMLEKWDSVDALKAHLQTPHMKAYGPIGQTFRQSSTFHVLTEAK